MCLLEVKLVSVYELSFILNQLVDSFCITFRKLKAWQIILRYFIVSYLHNSKYECYTERILSHEIHSP